MKKLLPLLLAGVLLISGCDAEEPSSSVPTELVVEPTTSETTEQPEPFPLELCGVQLTKPVERAVSLSPALTEIMAELNFSNKLCGASDYCDYPEGLTAERFGSAENPDIEGIIAAKPDVVFTLTALSERDIYSLNGAGIAVIMPQTPTDMEGFAALYETVATAFVGEASAASADIMAVSKLEGAAKPMGSFIYVTAKKTAAGAGTFEGAVLSLAGENLCTAEGYCAMDTLAELQPDYIIADDTLTEADLSDSSEPYAAMIYGGAEVIFVPAVRFERPSARTAEILEIVAAHIIGETTEAS